MIFKVIGDVHPDGHYLGSVKYHPDPRGDRRLFGRTYRQNTVVSKSFGILADRPECYVYSPVLSRVITGLPRQDIATHYSARTVLTDIATEPDRVTGTRAGSDLLAIIARIIERGQADLFGRRAQVPGPDHPRSLPDQRPDDPDLDRRRAGSLRPPDHLPALLPRRLPRRLHRRLLERRHRPPVRQTGPPPRWQPWRLRHRIDALERQQVLPRQPDRIARGSEPGRGQKPQNWNAKPSTSRKLSGNR